MWHVQAPQWIRVKDNLPEVNTPVLGFNEAWIDEDYNPEGINQCFVDDEGIWTIAVWNNYQDCWDTVYSNNPSMKHQIPAPISWKSFI